MSRRAEGDPLADAIAGFVADHPRACVAAVCAGAVLALCQVWSAGYVLGSDMAAARNSKTGSMSSPLEISSAARHVYF